MASIMGNCSGLFLFRIRHWPPTIGQNGSGTAHVGVRHAHMRQNPRHFVLSGEAGGGLGVGTDWSGFALYWPVSLLAVVLASWRYGNRAFNFFISPPRVNHFEEFFR